MRFNPLLIAGLLILPAHTLAQTVTIGTASQYDAGEYTVDAAALQEFEKTLSETLCERGKLSCTWKEMPRDELLLALETKDIDVMMAAIPVNEELGNAIEKTAPYLFLDPFTSVSLAVSQVQMHGSVESVAATPNPTIEAWHATTGYTITYFETVAEAMNAVENGQVDIAMGEYEEIAPLMEASKGTLEYVRENRQLRPGVAMAFHLDNVDLRFTFEDLIYDMTQDGSLNALTKELFGIDAKMW